MSNREQGKNVSRVENQRINNSHSRMTRSEYKRRKAARKRRIRRRRIRNGAVAVLVLELIILFIVLFFKTCNTDNRIVGTWDYDTVTVYRFDKGGKGTLVLPNASYDFSYSIDEESLFIDFENENVTDHTYTFSINENKLTLISDESTDAEYIMIKK